MNPELAAFFVVENALADCEHLLLHFRGPVCDLSVRPVTAVTGQLRDLLADQGVPLPPDIRAPGDPYALLRFILTACPGLAARAEAEICEQEILAAAAARPSPGFRSLLDGPASVSIIGDVCPAAIKGYLTRLYARQMDRVRLIIGRLGADPALLEPTSIPILQAAQLLGVPPAACAVVASTPDGIRAARQAGARAIGYACTAAADQFDDRHHRQHDPARSRRLLHRKTALAARPPPRAGQMTATPMPGRSNQKRQPRPFPDCIVPPGRLLPPRACTAPHVMPLWPGVEVQEGGAGAEDAPARSRLIAHASQSDP
jgi:hypothetical protein